MIAALWHVAVALLLGGAANSRAAVPPLRMLRIAAATALAAGVIGLFLEARELADGARVDAAALETLLVRTRIGRVWLTEHAALAVALFSLLVVRGQAARIVAVVLGATALAAAPFSSHSAGGEDSWLTISVHAAHLLAFALWFGGLAAHALSLLGRDAVCEPAARRALVAEIERFSRRAPILVAVLVASGLFLARVHVARWPALLGTAYGITLLVKLAAFAIALALAGRLRWRTLPRLRDAADEAGLESLRKWLFAEAVFGGLALLAAARLADTVPGAHDAIAWWLPFRFSIRATWGLPWVAERVGFGIALLVAAVAIGAGRWRRGERRGALVAVAAFASVAASFALPAIAVPAFPGTYRTPEVPYHAISVANGRKLYREHCVRCHGEAGRGDGPLASEQPKPPANLTEPHTADHTAGDMFWWLTHGMEEGGMPPFADVLTPDERWDLVNYLRAFASGYQGRILGARVSPGKPWLGAIDFNYRLDDGTRGLLRDFRGKSVVLLVLFTPGASDARLSRLREVLPEIRRAGAEVLAVPMAAGAAPGAFAPVPVLAGGAEEAAETFLLLRRTFSDPGNDADDDRPPHLELLVDRFGYVRARWRPDLEPEGWNDEELLLGEIDILEREPQILPPPDDHVH